MTDLARAHERLAWIASNDGIPITTNWVCRRDRVYVFNGGLVMHPFMADQIAATSIEDRFARILRTIGKRVDILAERACRKIDDAASVDTLEA